MESNKPKLMSEKDTFVKFFELKFLQIAAQVVSNSLFNFAYVGTDLSGMEEDLKARSDVEDIMEELLKFLNEQFQSRPELIEKLDSYKHDVPKEYIVTTERQRELSKERFGKVYDMDILAEIAEKSKWEENKNESII